MESTMTSFITKIVVAAAVSLGALGVTSHANAASVDVDVRIKTPHVVRRPVVVVKPAPVVILKPGYGRCSQNLALNKAMRNGLNRVSISHIGPNRVVVQGKIRGNWAKISFANVRGCPRL
jgi:hypothetical protein